MISHIEEISSFAGCPKGKVAMESKRLKYQRENCHFIDSGMIAIVVILKGICDTEINFVKNLTPFIVIQDNTSYVSHIILISAKQHSTNKSDIVMETYLKWYIIQ